MKETSASNQSARAFTLVELLAVLVVVAMLFGLAVPALARAKIKSPAAGCLSHLRQLMAAWSMYKEDNNDVLVPNAPLGTQGWISGNAQEGWGILDGNTNRNLLLSGLIISYLQNDTSVFKCPADVVPSLNGQRLRSYSMNGQMGESGFNEDPPAVLYYKGSDITCPTPANAFVFCDENPGSINDGYLQVNTQQGSFPDVPAAYHGTACGFSFADGHAEIHLWQTSTLDVPIISGRTYAEIGTSISNVDWVWFSQHTACNHY